MNAAFVQAAFYHLLAHFFKCRIAFRLSLELFSPPMSLSLSDAKRQFKKAPASNSFGSPFFCISSEGTV